MRMMLSMMFALLISLAFASSSSALQKRLARMVDDDRSDAWNAGATCRVSYYNICTGWVWVWSGFGDNAMIGQVMDACCDSDELSGLFRASIFCPTGAPTNRGFTGTLEAYAADANDCPSGPALAAAPFLPQSWASFTIVNFAGEAVPNRFVFVAHLQEDLGFPSPGSFGTEHPAAGPTGPQACGTCYPFTRVNRSFNYGTDSNPLCPGSPFNDGVCDSQLFWDVWLTCSSVVSTRPGSWGSIKSLYR